MLAVATAAILLLSLMTGLGHAVQGGGGGGGQGGPPDYSQVPCNTAGNLAAGDPVPNTYSYVLGQIGFVDGYVPLTPPSANPVNCNPALLATFGQTGLTSVNITMYVQSVTVNGVGVDEVTFSAVKNAFSFGFTTLTPGVPGNVPFTFTNSSSIPAGSYDVHFKTDSGGTINDANAAFVLTATEPTDGDSQPPEVTISSPTGNPKVLVNGALNISFTAKDPPEDGVGTGVYAVGATITSSGGTVNQDISGDLTLDSVLPAPAGTYVTVSGAVQMNQVGSYRLTAVAKDGCAFPELNLNCEGDVYDHISSASTPFSVGVALGCLPPISIAGRQFNSGSTVPVKWAFTDANGAFLPPYNLIKAVISGGPGGVTAYAGSGASNIRWELDGSGNATQYIVNFPIPATLTANATYTATISVQDVDGDDAVQGTCTFIASPAKGGKVK